jgi:hypothetical protein
MELTDAIRVLFQTACNQMAQAARAGNLDERDRFYDLSIAIENSYPDEVKAYLAKIGISDH